MERIFAAALSLLHDYDFAGRLWPESGTDSDSDFRKGAQEQGMGGNMMLGDDFNGSIGDMKGSMIEMKPPSGW